MGKLRLPSYRPKVEDSLGRTSILMLRVRLRLLLTSFNKSVADYTLARLEVALRNPGIPSPPPVDRLSGHWRPDNDVAAKWPIVLGQVGAAADYVAAGNRGALEVQQGVPWARLARAVKLMLQFAESIDAFGAQAHVNAETDEGV